MNFHGVSRYDGGNQASIYRRCTTHLTRKRCIVVPDSAATAGETKTIACNSVVSQTASSVNQQTARIALSLRALV